MVSTSRQRRRILFRARRRGMRELDLLLEKFSDLHLDKMSNEELAIFENLLEIPDTELFSWILGQVPVPPSCASHVLDKLCQMHSVLSDREDEKPLMGTHVYP